MEKIINQNIFKMKLNINKLEINHVMNLLMIMKVYFLHNDFNKFVKIKKYS